MGNNSKRKDVPSEWGVPHQVRFPNETAANQGVQSTSRPTDDASSGWPGPVPIPAPRTKLDIYLAGGAFNYKSHTNGRDRE